MTSAILPGATLGILGSGQLGRMLSFEAKRMGYKVHIYSPSKDSPAGQVSDKEIVASYTDLTALKAFAQEVDIVTLEFENIPVDALNVLEQHVAVHPSPKVLHIAQNRLREKTFLHENNLPVVPFKQIDAEADIENALLELGTPAVMKTAGFGYDGKGQAIINTFNEAREAYKTLGGGTVILEAFINYRQELSVIGARNQAGDYADYGVIENDHQHHILDVSVAPSSLSENIQAEACAIAKTTLEAFDIIGIMCVEFFLTTDNQLLINEVAPRPHNSGHLTIEANVTSQFAQQLRAVCNLPLGATEFIKPAVMINLLGDLWQDKNPNWQNLLNMPQTYLHLYGKAEARAGRKMGHITALAEHYDDLEALGKRIKATL